MLGLFKVCVNSLMPCCPFVCSNQRAHFDLSAHVINKIAYLFALMNNPHGFVIGASTVKPTKLWVAGALRNIVISTDSVGIWSFETVYRPIDKLSVIYHTPGLELWISCGGDPDWEDDNLCVNCSQQGLSLDFMRVEHSAERLSSGKES